MSKYVHDLVSKMTMREKGYFTKMSSQGRTTEKNYLILYNYVEQSPVYKKAEAIEKFKNLTLGKYLSSEYNYLAEQLMKSLINFHFEKTDKNKIRKSILFINVLIEKGLRTKALKILNHIKKSAYKNEYFSQVLTLIDLEEEILFKQGILGFTQNLKNIELERQRLIDKINNLNHFRLLREQIKDLWIQEGFLKTRSHSVLNDSILSSKKNGLSIRAQEHWHYIVAMKDFILQKHNMAISKFGKGIVFIEQHDNLFNRDHLLVYISNYLYNCALAKDISAFKDAINKLNSLEETLYTKYIFYSRSLEISYQLRDLKKNDRLDSELSIYIEENSSKMELAQSNYIYFLMVRNRIIQRDFEKALDYINDWLQIKLIDFYYLHIKLFILIIHLELENYTLLESEIKTTYKFLKRHKQYNDTAKKMIASFKKVLRFPQRERHLLQNLKQDLSLTEDNEIKEKNYKYFDYLIWIDSRIELLT